MPIIAAPVTTPPDPGTSPDAGGGIVIPDYGRATVTYYDPTGKEWPLTTPSLGWKTLADGVSGLGAVPYELTTDAHPRGGARLRHVQAQPRTIVWPLRVYGSTHTEFVGRWRQLAAAFTRTLRPGPDGLPTPGLLEIARPDGSRRRIEVFYQDGFEGLGNNTTGRIVDVAVLSLWCEDPYWADALAVSIHRETGTPVDYLNPYPSVSSSQVLGATTVVNPGDVDVWPVWTITGPATSITFTREDTGDAFTLDMQATSHGALLAGQTVTISTDPPRVRSGTGENLVAGLNWPEAVLWSVPPGETPVVFQLNGAEAGSAVDLTFYPRYETA
ncbi:phage tail protein [Streptomyces sp. NPDC058534]|uniref:phage tail protein n=1 Tax=Streptomyces sp. NPDC058534 TaxID=3346541 RepID=UPI00364EEB5F